MHSKVLSWVTVALIVIAAGACVDSDHTEPPADAASAMTVRVMSFNIEWGGTHVSFDKVVEAIRKADADIVGIQEAEGNLQRLADELGWYYDRRNYVISRYPLLDPPGANGLYVYVEVQPGRVVAIGNVHLPSSPYSPDAIRDGATAEDALAIEKSARLPKIEPYIAVLPSLAALNIPVFVTGDFNAPSDTDWTESTAKTRPSVRFPVAWPVSLAMSGAGFVDSWRSLHPDAAAEPGLTWWAARPPLVEYTLTEHDPSDRIDFVWFAGPATALDSTIVGEPGARGVSISVEPWPSDHRSVLSEFSVQPAPLPELITAGRRVYRQGDDVDLRYVPYDALPAGITVRALDRDGDTVAPGDAPAAGRLRIPAESLLPGHYRATMPSASRTDPYHYDFWVLARDATPQVEVLADDLDEGQPIRIRWRNAPGNRNDYVVVYSADAMPVSEGDDAWAYLQAMPAGELQLDADTSEGGWPVPPGRYVVHLMKDDGFESLATSGAFRIGRAAN